MTIRDLMQKELQERDLFVVAAAEAMDYLDNVSAMRVFPSEDELNELRSFHEPLPDQPTAGKTVLSELASIGTKGTINQIGPRYFGFVNGGAIPVTQAVKWLSAVWDQCGGLYLTSPINAELEMVCEKWMKSLLGLPESTIAGFVSGTSMANLSALCAARYYLLKQQGWDIFEKGLRNAPKIRIIAHDQVHASIKKTLSMLGFGDCDVEWLPSDDQGRMKPTSLPEIDSTCLILLQAGNVNTGAFDPFAEVCHRARKVKAWVHIDGAFGLWAAATKRLSYLTKGIEMADSWSVDGHKTLNTPYDSGIVLCKRPDALISALQASGEYIIYSERKDPLMTTPEMSKRSRAIELWAALKFLGRSGVSELVEGLHDLAVLLGSKLEKIGYSVINDVVFNQVLVRYKNDDSVEKIIHYVQASGVCWCGGTTWKNQRAIRLSVCSWRTDKTDIEKTVEVFKEAIVELKFNS